MYDNRNIVKSMYCIVHNENMNELLWNKLILYVFALILEQVLAHYCEIK